MTDNRPIGIFDSGLGGLTAIPFLRKKLPKESFVYFGDTARTPYGSKEPETVRRFSKQILEYLLSKDVKAAVIACNTISASSADFLRKEYPGFPIIDIVTPTANAICRAAASRESVGIICTQVTAQSGAYEEKVKSLRPDIRLSVQPCPGFVPLIEAGKRTGPVIEAEIHDAMDRFMQKNKITTLVLGCTHYPLIRPLFERFYPGIRIINSSEELANEVKSELSLRSLLADGSCQSENIFSASDLSPNFLQMIETIFAGEPYQVQFQSVESIDVK